MLILYAERAGLTVRQREQLASGNVNACTACFQFSDDWEGLTRTALFRAGPDAPIGMLLDKNGMCTVPWEALAKPGVRLLAGVCGTRDGEVVLPTVWADCGYIRKGAAPDGGVAPPTPALWEQALGRKGDALAFDGQNLSLMSGDRLLDTVQITDGTEAATEEEIREMLDEVFGGHDRQTT